MSGIPQDLITEILLRLPVKSICRCKCVPKTWRVLLSGPTFVKAHLKLQLLRIQDPEDFIFTSFTMQPLHILTFRRESRWTQGISRAVNFPINDDRVWIKVVALCHGLVLIILNRRDECWAILMNPITLETVEVQHRHYASCAYGMGFDSSKDDFIIVSISTESIVDIYSVKMRTWRRLANFPHDIRTSPPPGVFLNDRIHWMTFTGSRTLSSWVLAAFNLASEEFEEVPLPSGVDFDGKNEIGALDGCLVLVHESYLDFTDIGVWMMKEYGVQNSWTKLFSIRNPIFEFICLLSKDEIVLRRNGLGLVTYNQRNGA